MLLSNVQEVRVRCHAKTNPYLRIVARREDGYHELETVYLSVSLADELRAIPSDMPGVRLEMTGPYAEALVGEDPEKNLAVRAWRATEDLVQSRGDLPDNWPGSKKSSQAGILLKLEKNIPLGAGLAGGSADAAGAIAACCSMAGISGSGAFSPSSKLFEIAASLGSDVPFCLEGGCAFGRGRGEKLEAWPVPGNLEMLLVKPRFSIATAEAYASCQPEGSTAPAAINTMRSVLDELAKNQDNPDATATSLAVLFHNTFYHAQLPHFSELRNIEEQLRSAGALHVQLSGSGSALMAVFSDDVDLDSVHSDIDKASGVDGAWIVKPVKAGLVVT